MHKNFQSTNKFLAGIYQEEVCNETLYFYASRLDGVEMDSETATDNID